ncbi:pyruvate formate-lyase-activating protein [Sutterella sp.]|uniref:pyruvate formate-lyase-activating protein n=1 Tax=Sutterella sp. TaxID=1981025 RepID=UPI0026E0824D|nr:pyruvate formate-lyase-activating protein [Sutterella sp.]MDO5530854.1 pyruvate formate-lyase-activating protein [Sutterella sp.]
MTIGRIHSFETFGSVDGPGVRFVVFVQGCRMRCAYCHNPDTWRVHAGEEIEAEAVLRKALRYRTYWGTKGGITVSGGEPLLQIEFVTELFRLAKAQGVNTTLDTSGAPFSRDPEWLAKFDDLMSVTDLVMLDIKHIDTEAHRHLTGFGNENILDCARHLSDIGKAMWIRHVLVPEWTDDDAALERLAAFIRTLKTVDRVEVLPYHGFAEPKWELLRIPCRTKGLPSPTRERIANAERILGARVTDLTKKSS